ncbi:MAG: Uma2 family endonuclease [Myxococcaceae bacterium]|jgi:Uma2 family endonuclease|nr:Uma2 family endonuclease [Myxococcaceae bacterium]
MTAAEKLKMSYPEYLAAEERSAEKHDFLDGEVFAMSGGTLRHSTLCHSAGRLLGNALASRRCIVFESNARVRRVEGQFSCYPDVTVVCGPVRRAVDDEEAIANPTLIIEVLSASTEAYDRGEKARQYTRIGALQEFAFVSQTERRVEVFRRNASGRFELYDFSETAVEFASVGATIDLAALYADAEALDVTAPPPEE